MLLATPPHFALDKTSRSQRSSRSLLHSHPISTPFFHFSIFSKVVGACLVRSWRRRRCRCGLQVPLALQNTNLISGSASQIRPTRRPSSDASVEWLHTAAARSTSCTCFTFSRSLFFAHRLRCVPDAPTSAAISIASAAGAAPSARHTASCTVAAVSAAGSAAAVASADAPLVRTAALRRAIGRGSQPRRQSATSQAVPAPRTPRPRAAAPPQPPPCPPEWASCTGVSWPSKHNQPVRVVSPAAHRAAAFIRILSAKPAAMRWTRFFVAGVRRFKPRDGCEWQILSA